VTEQQHRTATPTTAGTNGTHGPSSDNPLVKRFASSRRWVLWKRELRNGAWTKVCYQVDGRKAASTRPAEWSTLAQVEAKRAKYDGIGLMFAPDKHLIGIDLDHVVDQGAITDPASRDLVEAAQTHTELSPSGTGLHLWLLMPEPIDLIRNKHGSYEVYNCDRYLTVTGAIFGEAREIRTVTPAEMSQLLTIVGYPWTKSAKQDDTRPASSAQPVTLDDHALIEKARSSKHGAEFDALWSGNCDAKKADGTPDWSVADMRLVCRLIWWTGRDAARTERLWQQSGLGKRDKVAERADYRARTIERALALVAGGYDPASRRTPTAPDVPDFDDIGNQDDNRIEDQNVGEDPAAAGRDQAEVDAYLNARPMSEQGDAECMARLYGDQLRYVPQLGWLKWTGAYWRADNADVLAYQLAMRTARARQGASVRMDDNEKRAKMFSWSLRGENVTRINATVTLATRTAPFVSEVEDWDQHKHLLATPTATIDLRTGEEYEPNREDRITRCAGADYDPGAKCPRWDQFLVEVFTDPKTGIVDQDLIDYVQRCVGYSLTGETNEQVFWLLFGNGANGKSKFVEVLQKLAGDYHYRTSFSLFEADGADREASITMSELRGKRLLTMIETDEDHRLAEARVKNLTGEDAIEARPMYHKPINFVPQFKAWVAMNHKPEIRGRDHALWRRLKPIPWRQTFDGDRRDKYLIEKLLDELSGILNWAIQGARDWYAQGLVDPATVTAEAVAYRQQSDLVGQWIEERTDQDPHDEMLFATAYRDFSNWANEHGFKRHPNSTIWRRRLDEKGIETERRGGQIRIKGYSLRTVTQP
jgi:putative DNA primase/helicase